jgi:hypothetical protein
MYATHCQDCKQLFDAVPVWEKATEQVKHREALLEVYRRVAKEAQQREKERQAETETQQLAELAVEATPPPPAEEGRGGGGEVASGNDGDGGQGNSGDNAGEVTHGDGEEAEEDEEAESPELQKIRDEAKAKEEVGAPESEIRNVIRVCVCMRVFRVVVFVRALLRE